MLIFWFYVVISFAKGDQIVSLLKVVYFPAWIKVTWASSIVKMSSLYYADSSGSGSGFSFTPNMESWSPILVNWALVFQEKLSKLHSYCFGDNGFQNPSENPEDLIERS